VEACGGTHLKNTGEIGFIKIVHTERIQDGVERIVFSAGLPALEAVQENDNLLWKLSELLSVPREKLLKTTERIIKDWKEARREIVIHETARATTIVRVMKITPINGVNFATQDFGQISVDVMIKTASEEVKRDPKMVAVFWRTDNNKTARIVVVAGKDAVKLGINARDIANETATVLGGGGSGRPDFAQGGGTLIRKVPEALRKAEEVIREQLGEGK